MVKPLKAGAGEGQVARWLPQTLHASPAPCFPQQVKKRWAKWLWCAAEHRAWALTTRAHRRFPPGFRAAAQALLLAAHQGEALSPASESTH